MTLDVVETNDFLGDHYDPTKKQLHLSTNVYNTPSVASLGIAAHETRARDFNTQKPMLH